jgi:hypothetical protein
MTPFPANPGYWNEYANDTLNYLFEIEVYVAVRPTHGSFFFLAVLLYRELTDYKLLSLSPLASSC